ncbi:MAG: LysR family transcriptional regulator [Caulobacterales bacterium]
MPRANIDLRPRVIVGDARAMGPGKADLLDQIIKCGSISAAAKAMNMSYSRAWQLVDAMNKAFKKPVVESATGGAKGGGAQVTEVGRAVLSHYREMQTALDAKASEHVSGFQKYLK